MPLRCVGWLEDANTSGGAAALAAIPVTEQHGIKLSGADTIVLPEHPTWLRGIEVSDETPPTTDAGYISVSGRTSPIRLPVVPAGQGFGRRWFRNPIPLPAGGTLDCLANGSGAGAEEHGVIAFLEDPAAPAWPATSVPADAFAHPVEMVTDAPAAAYRATTVEYSGRTNAYEDSAEILPDLDGIGVYLDAIQAELTAGYTLLVVEDNSYQNYLMFPCASTYDRKVHLSDYIGGALYSGARDCHLVGVSGVTTATQQLYLDLYVSGWKGAEASVGAHGAGSRYRVTGTRSTRAGPALDTSGSRASGGDWTRETRGGGHRSPLDYF